LLADKNMLGSFAAAAKSDKRLGLEVHSEQQYLKEQAGGLATMLGVLGTMVAILMAVAVLVAALVAQYAAVATRKREFGTLRALGFARLPILASLMVETLLISVTGASIGALASLLLGRFTIAMPNPASWSEVVFTFTATPSTVLGSFAAAVTIGTIGGFFPGVRAASIRPLDALRD